MSETDSFIDEVSEEVRKDRLYGTFRKYGWIAISAVLLVVGVAAYNEWRKAQAAASSQAAGDQILAALEAEEASERAEALSSLTFDDPQRQALVKLQEASMLIEDGRPDEAAAVFEAVAGIEAAGLIYTDLAKIKLLMIAPESETAASLIDELSGIDRPFRLLAVEQRALAALRSGDTEGALNDLSGIVQDAQATQDLRERAGQLIVVLGGDLPETPSLLPTDGDG